VPVALGEPGREAAAGRGEPRAELRVERSNLIAKLEEAEVEQPLGVADVSAHRSARYGCPAVGTRHVRRFGVGTKHCMGLYARPYQLVGTQTVKVS
jgi:hypothetical protein